MKTALLYLLAWATAGAADQVPAPFPLCAVAGGPQVALWQGAANPNKPYIAQLFAPGEKPLPLLVDSPPDHFHHHGLMFALGVDDTDFWSEKGIANAGRQVPPAPNAAPQGNGFTSNLQWLATDGTKLLDETRQVRVRTTGTGAATVNWLDWQSTLAVAAGRDSVRLSGAHYFGLGMRFLPAWDQRAEWIWANTAGQYTVRGDEKITPGPWCAARCEIDGRSVTVLMIDHPANPRPVRWFTMREPFCYLSAALGLDKEPARLAKGETWTLRYGIAVFTTPADPARLAKLAEEWRQSASIKTPATPTPSHP